MSVPADRGRMMGVRVPTPDYNTLRIYTITANTTVQAVLAEALLEWGERHGMVLPYLAQQVRESGLDTESDSPAVFVKNAG